MPTSKDILKDAKKDLDDNSTAEKALSDILEIGQKDLGEFAKAKAVLRTSITSMEKMTNQLEDQLKKLIKDQEALEKQKAVMAAPADAKVYEAIVKAFEAEKKQQRTYQLKLDALVKQAKTYM
jgi:hypothetical protein